MGVPRAERGVAAGGGSGSAVMGGKSGQEVVCTPDVEDEGQLVSESEDEVGLSRPSGPEQLEKKRREMSKQGCQEAVRGR